MRRMVAPVICALGLLTPEAAFAAGGPVTVAVGGPGVSTTGSPYSFIALDVGRSTVVERVRRDGPSVDFYNVLPGQFGVPAATYDGTDTGLSADARTLVLAGVPTVYPPTRTPLVVVGTERLRPRARITFPGYFTVDAISPTGRWLYLIHYPAPTNPARYEVRAYDLVKRHLLRKPVVDPREPDEKMLGQPLTRTTSADGRWVYTLYFRGDSPPFIHALDTASRNAFCVDLPRALASEVTSARLVLAPGDTLRIQGQNAPLAVMNTRTFAVHRADATPATPRHRATAVKADQSGLPWALIAAPVAALITVAVLARRRRRSPSPSAVPRRAR